MLQKLSKQIAGDCENTSMQLPNLSPANLSGKVAVQICEQEA